MFHKFMGMPHVRIPFTKIWVNLSLRYRLFQLKSKDKQKEILEEIAGCKIVGWDPELHETWKEKNRRENTEKSFFHDVVFKEDK